MDWALEWLNALTDTDRITLGSAVMGGIVALLTVLMRGRSEATLREIGEEITYQMGDINTKLLLIAQVLIDNAEHPDDNAPPKDDGFKIPFIDPENVKAQIQRPPEQTKLTISPNSLLRNILIGILIIIGFVIGARIYIAASFGN